MGKKGKTGKSRQDKFYKLAKETGYRSRAAFKLIQLNRKFGFLQKSRVCVDLCAAPGGWLQVAHQNMPLSSLIIGVDLVPIKPVTNCVTFAEDIKTEKCRQLIRKELKTWDADVFLHDGAPNMGKNWLHDAYQQNELTLYAVKLASEFMRKGGWFVTKVFRSKDYHALMWLFKKLFKKVFATKPQASRHESAEIFIVCEGYLKPDKIDPRLMDPKHVFKEMEKEAAKTWEKGNQVSQLFKMVEKTKKPAVGYEEEGTGVFKTISVKDFLANETFAESLANCNEIVIDEDDILNNEATTEEVKECCKDLKVLGRKELKLLIGWRKKLIKHFEDMKRSQDKGDPMEEEMKEPDETNDDDDLEKVLKETEESERKELKKKKRKEAKKKQKLRERIAMKMVHVGDKFDETKDDEMFDLKRISSGKGLDAVADTPAMPEVMDDQLEDDDDPLTARKPKLMKFKKNADDADDQLVEVKDREYMGEQIDNQMADSDEEESDDDMDHESDVEIEDGDNIGIDNSDVEDDDDDDNPLIENLTGDKTKEDRLKRKTSLWFSKDIFNDIDEDEEKFELGQATTSVKESYKETGGKENEEKLLGSDGEGPKEEDPDEDSESDSDSEDEIIKRKIIAEKENERDSFEVVPQTDVATVNNDGSKRKQILDPEGLAIASFIIQSKKNRREIEEAGFNKWVSNDKNLPDWFVKDQKQHWRNRLPVQITKEMVEEYKKRKMEIDARPIKKVAEAKARKKRKALKQLEKIKKKAEAVVDKEGASEKEKALEIKKMYKKALKRKKTETKLIVAKKGGKGVKGTKPGKGVKYKVVDSRMKKDKRAQEKKASKGKRGKAGKAPSVGKGQKRSGATSRRGGGKPPRAK